MTYQPWPDASLKSQAEDEFDRVEYAVHAAKLIVSSHSWDASVVYGLTGPWGSGKTSMLAMIEEEIRKRHKVWRVARFTPWATNDVAGLLADFYATLTAALPPDRARQARQSLGALADLTAPAAESVPAGGRVVASALRMSGAASRKTLPLQQAIDNARVAFRRLGTPLLVIADDIERLQADELMALLKVVRLLGRFDGVHYLLAYDEASLLATLATTAPASGDEATPARFLEKIVQYPLMVPALTGRQLATRIEEGIEGVLRGAGRAQPTPGRLGDLEDVFRSLLSTPRAVDRFLAQLRHHMPLLAAGEVDDEDVVVLTLLRTVFPLVYAQLPSHAGQLTSGHNGELDPTTTDFQMVGFDISVLLRQVHEPSRAQAARLLRDLFPALPADGPVVTQQVRRPRGVADEAYFERYFTMNIPDGDVSDTEVAKIVDGTVSDEGVALRQRLLRPQVDSAAFIEKAATHTAVSGVDDPMRFALLSTLIPVIDAMAPDGGFLTSARDRANRWAIALMSELSDGADARRLIEILDGLTALDQRAGLTLRAARAAEHRSAWFAELTAHVGSQVCEAFVAHVALRDDAPPPERDGWLITILYELRHTEQARDLLSDGIEDGQFALEDVAARFVSVTDNNGNQPRLATSRRDEYEALAPVGDADWYRLPIEEVDVYDISWANRRRGARGRFAQPQPPRRG